MKILDKYRVVAVHSMQSDLADQDGQHQRGKFGALDRFIDLASDIALDATRAVCNATTNGNTDFVIDAYVIPRSVMAQILKGMA